MKTIMNCGEYCRLIACLFVGILILHLTNAMGQEVSSNEPNWELRIVPVEPVVPALGDAEVLISVKNIGPQPQQIALPTEPGSPWPQWIQVIKDGKRLPAREDEDFVYKPTLLRSGETTTLLVRLDCFYTNCEGANQEGDVILLWKGSTIGKAKDVKAAVSVSLQAGPIANMRSEEYYEQRTGSKDTAVIKQRIWAQVNAKPFAADVLPLLERIPGKLLDVDALLGVARSSGDVGVRRQAIRRAMDGIDQEEMARRKTRAEGVMQLLKEFEDPSLKELLIGLLHKLQKDK